MGQPQVNDPGSSVETYAIKTVKKPSFSITEIPHQYMSHTFHYPGRVTWNPVDITFVDPVNPDMSAILSNIVVASGYNVPKSEQLAKSSMSKELFTAAVGTPTITQLDAAGEVIETWTLANAFITNLDYGQLDYAADELVILSMTLRYDYAQLNTVGSVSSLI